MSTTIAIIPARGGSKSVPGKNIKSLGGFPLIAYSIIAARISEQIERVMVSTDSEEIANVALSYGADVPFLRPAELSGDNSTDLELFRHAIGWFEENEETIPEFLVHIRPTTPLRIPSEIDMAISYIKDREDATSLRSAHELPEPPQKMFQVDEKGFFRGFFPNDPREEYYNLPRQVFPKAYHPNGYVDIIKTEFVRCNNMLHGCRMLAFITDFTVEVDTFEEFDYLEYRLSKKSNPVYDYLLNHYSEVCVK